jgi:hypothetical protein
MCDRHGNWFELDVEFAYVRDGCLIYALRGEPHVQYHKPVHLLSDDFIITDPGRRPVEAVPRRAPRVQPSGLPRLG